MLFGSRTSLLLATDQREVGNDDKHNGRMPHLYHKRRRAMYGIGIGTGARNGVEVKYGHYVIHNMKPRNIVFQSTARSLRTARRQFLNGYFVRDLSCQTDEFLWAKEFPYTSCHPLAKLS